MAELKYYKMAVLVFESVDISTLPSLSNASHNQNLDDRDRVFVIEMVARDALTWSSSLTVEADRLLQTRWIESGNTISSLYPVQHHTSMRVNLRIRNALPHARASTSRPAPVHSYPPQPKSSQDSQ